MVAKIIPVYNISNCITYVMEKEGSELLDSSEVRAYDVKLMIEDFNYNQSLLDSRVKIKSYHTAISFNKDDDLTSDTFKEICNKVILGMGWSDCPYLIVRHYDQKSGNPHCHIIVGRCGLDGKATDNRFSFQRMNIIRSEIEKQYPFLKPANGKNISEIDESRLKGNDEIKYIIYKAISQELLLPIENVKELLDRLKDKHGIISQVIKNERNVGLLFSVIGKPGWVKSSQVDKLFTFQQLERTIEAKWPNHTHIKTAEPPKSKFFQEYLSDRINQLVDIKLIFESKNGSSITSSINSINSIPETNNIDIYKSINIERREDDKLYIKKAIKAEIYQASSIDDLINRLDVKYEICSNLILKRQTDGVVQGIKFSISGTDNWFNGSSLKKEFSYVNLLRAIEKNIIEGETDIKPIIRIESIKQNTLLDINNNLSAIDESKLLGDDAIDRFIYKAISQELLLPTKNVLELFDRLKEKHGIISQVINNDRNVNLLFSVIGKPSGVKSSQIDKLFTFQQLEKTIEDKWPNHTNNKAAANEPSKTKFFQEYLSDRINQLEGIKLIFESKNGSSITSSINSSNSIPETNNIDIYKSINIERREDDKLYIKKAIKAEIYQASSIDDLINRLDIKYRICSNVILKRQTDGVVQGIKFSISGTDSWFNGSSLKKEFSYFNLLRAIEKNIAVGETDIKPIIRIESIKQNTLLDINNNLSAIDESKLIGDDAIDRFIYKAINQELLLPTKNVRELLDRLKEKHGIISQVINNDRNVNLLFSVIGKPSGVKSSQIDKLFTFQQLEKTIEDKWPNHTNNKAAANEPPKTKFQEYLCDRKNQMEETKLIFESKNDSLITSSINSSNSIPETNNIDIYKSINMERREDDKLYIKKAIKAEIYQASSIDDLINRLDIKYRICSNLILKRQTDGVVQGIKFSISGTDSWFNGSSLKKEFSYFNLLRAIEKNIAVGKVDIKASIIKMMNQGSSTRDFMNTKENPSQNLNKIDIESLKLFIKESVKEAQLASNSIEELVKVLKNEFEIIIDTEPMLDGEELNLLFTVSDTGIIFSEEELDTGIDANAIESIIEEEEESDGKSTKFSQKSKHTFSSGSEGNKHKRKGKPIFSENDPKVRNFGLNGEIYFKNPKRKR